MSFEEDNLLNFSFKNKKNIDIIKKLIELYYINKLNEQLESLFDIAILRGDVDVVRVLIDWNVDFCSKIFSFLQRRDVEGLRFLVDAGADVNVVDGGGVPALICAIRDNNVDVVRVLVDAGADVNVVDGGGVPALICAIRDNNVDVVRVLVDAGADVNVVDGGGVPALICAIRDNNVDVVRVLVDAGADVNIVDSAGNSAFLLAVKTGDVDLVRTLIDAGADFSSKFLSSIYVGDVEGLRFLLEAGADVNIVDSAGNSAFDLAVKTGDVDLVRTLIDAGADVNMADDAGLPALICAIRDNNVDVVRVLVDAGADVNMADDAGLPALICAIRGNNVDVVRVLVDAGADVNMAGDCCMYPLICSILERNPAIVELLLEKGANVNVVDSDGNSALIYAVRNSDIDLVRILVECGTDLNAVDEEGDSAIDIARKSKYFNIVEFLLDCGADENLIVGVHEPKPIVKEKHFEIVEGLNKTSNNDYFFAVKNGDIFKVELILKSGGDINVVDEQGNSALIYAVRNSDVDLVKVLVKHGVNLNFLDKKGFSPLLTAILADDIDIVKILIESGAYVNSKIKRLLKQNNSYLKYNKNSSEKNIHSNPKEIRSFNCFSRIGVISDCSFFNLKQEDIELAIEDIEIDKSRIQSIIDGDIEKPEILSDYYSLSIINFLRGNFAGAAYFLNNCIDLEDDLEFWELSFGLMIYNKQFYQAYECLCTIVDIEKQAIHNNLDFNEKANFESSEGTKNHQLLKTFFKNIALFGEDFYKEGKNFENLKTDWINLVTKKTPPHLLAIYQYLNCCMGEEFKEDIMMPEFRSWDNQVIENLDNENVNGKDDVTCIDLKKDEDKISLLEDDKTNKKDPVSSDGPGARGIVVDEDDSFYYAKGLSGPKKFNKKYYKLVDGEICRRSDRSVSIEREQPGVVISEDDNFYYVEDGNGVKSYNKVFFKRINNKIVDKNKINKKTNVGKLKNIMDEFDL